MKKGLLLIFVMLTVSRIFSQTTFDWLNTAPDGNFRQGASGTARWNPGGLWDEPGFGILRFNNTHQLANTNNVSGTYNQHQLQFGSSNTSSRTIGGNTMRFFDNGGADPKIENYSSVLNTINLNIEGDGDVGDPLEINPVNGDLTIGGTVNNRGSSINVFGSSSRTLRFNGIISGSGGLTLTSGSNNTVILAAANTYTGTTTVSGGTLRISATQSLVNLDLSSGGNLTIDAGATLTITGTYTPGTGTIDNQGTLVLQGGGNHNFPVATTVTNMNNLSISKSSGVVTLTSNLTISGVLTLTGGTLAVDTRTLTLNGGAISGSGTLSTTSSSNLTFGGTNPGPLTIPSTVANLNNLTINNTNATPAIVNINNSITVAGVLAFTSGTLSIGANTLTLAGTVSRSSGVLRGGLTSNLTIQGSTVKELFFDHSTDGTTDVIQNLTLSSSGRMQIGNNTTSVGVSQLFITGTLDVQSGTNLDVDNVVTANHLVLVSDGTRQARVANVAGSINQDGDTKIVVERFTSLPGTTNNRSWRFITAPLTGGGGSINRTVQYQWQNHQSSPANTLGGTAFGTNIYGPSGNTGMDGTTAGNTMRGWDYGTKAYANVTNTTTEVLFGNSGSAANKPYMLFVRGDKTRTPTNGFTSSTRLRAVGRLQTGNQAFSYLTANTTDFVAAANPYACQIDWESIRLDGTALSNINSSQYFLWDPRSGSFGAWVTVNNDGSGGYFTTPTSPASFSASESRYIQSGQVFFVKVSSNGTSGITFKESHKLTTNTNATITGAGNGLMDRLGVDLLLINTDNSISVRDGLLMKYKNNFTTAINEATGEDVLKMNQSDETISIMQGSTKLGIEGRGFIQNTDTIKLQMERMVTGTNYKLAFIPANFDATVTDARLIDKFLNTETPISLTANTDIPFTITSTTGSNAADRFMIVFRGTGNLPNNKLSLVATKKDKDVQLTWNIANEIGVKAYELQRSVDGTNFQAINNQVANNKGEYNNLDTKANNGINYYRVKMTMLNDDVRFSNTITINLKATNNNPITIYPNPVKGKTIGLQLAGLDKGEYALRLVNAAGQTVYTQNIQVQGANMSMQVTTNQLLAKGSYSLQLISNKGETYNQQVLVVE